MPPSRFRFGLIAAAIASLALVACGGGGGDAPVTTPPPTGGNPPPAPPPSSPPPTAGSFSLRLDSDKAIVFQDGTATVRVRVVRSGGFDGAVNLSLSGLPAGVSFTPTLVAAGATEASITLRGEASAPHSLPTAASVEGSASIGDSTLRQTQTLTTTVRGQPGVVDTSFAGGATLTPVGNSEDYAHAVAVQADGKVLMAGSSASPQGTRIAVVRYLRDGSLDASFGTEGKAIVAVGVREDVARAIAVQPDGRIVVAGLSYQGTADYDFALVRLMPDGTPDASFGNQGRVTTDFGGDSDRAFALLVMPDGRIVAGGQTNVQGGNDGVNFALARYLSDGRPDTSFGQGGKVTQAVLSGNSGDLVRGLALQTVNGSPRLLAVGGEGDFTAARFTESGALDTSFGQNGVMTHAVAGGKADSGRAIALQPDERVPAVRALVGGEAQNTNRDFALLRLWL